MAQAISHAPRGGRVTIMGVSMEDDGFPPGLAMSKELDVNFSLGLEPGEVETAIAVLASGRISTSTDDYAHGEPRRSAARLRRADQTVKSDEGDARIIATRPTPELSTFCASRFLK